MLSPTRFSYTNRSLVNLSEKKGWLCTRVEQPPQRFASTLNLLPQLCSLLSQRFSSWKLVSGGVSAEVTSADLWGTAPSPLRTSPRHGAAVTGPLRPGCHTSSSFPLRCILPAGSTTVLGFEPQSRHWAGLGCRSVIGKGLQDSKMSPRGREEKQPHLWPLPECWARDGAVGRHTVSPGWRPCWRINACLLFGSWKGTWLLLLLKGQAGVE